MKHLERLETGWSIAPTKAPTLAPTKNPPSEKIPLYTEFFSYNRRKDTTAETELSDEIRANRDAGLSWICHTLSKALADDGEVPSGLNQRHPDFAAFAVRIGCAMGREAEAVSALRSAESDKSTFNLENDTVGAALLELVQSGGPFEGTAGELLDSLKEVDSSFEGRLSTRRLSKRLSKLWPHLQAVFNAESEKGHGGYTRYRLKPPRNGDCGDYEYEGEYREFCRIVDWYSPNSPEPPGPGHGTRRRRLASDRRK